jgi:hypothetical protein
LFSQIPARDARRAGFVELDAQSKVAGNDPNNCVSTDACKA